MFFIVYFYCIYGGLVEGVKMRIFVVLFFRDFSFFKDSEDIKGFYSDIFLFDVGGLWFNRDF